MYRKGSRGGSGPFFFERNVHGVPYWYALGDSLSHAINLAEHINYCLREGKPVERLQNRKGVSHAQFLDFAYRDIETSPMPVTTRNKKRSVLNLWQRFRFDHHSDAKALREITPEIAQEFVNWRLRQRVTRNGTTNADALRRQINPKTVKVEMQVFRPLWDAAVKRGWIGENPFRSVTLPRVDHSKSKGRLVTEDVAKRLFAAARKFDATPEPKGRASGYRGIMEDAIRLLLATGLRRGELRMLPWSRVDLDQNIINIEKDVLVVRVRLPIRWDRVDKLAALAERRAKKETLFPDARTLDSIFPKRAIKQAQEALLRLSPSEWNPGSDHVVVSIMYEWQPKGMEAPIPLSPEAARILKRRKRDRSDVSPFVFPHPDGGPLRSDFWHRFQQVCQQAGINEHIRPHDLRHSFGRYLRKSGTPLDVIQHLMRHRTAKDTLLYSPLTLEESRDYLARSEAARKRRRS